MARFLSNMTTPNLEQIARETAEKYFPKSYDHGQAPGYPDSVRQSCEWAILTALRSVAPQPAKTEEVSTKPTDAQRAEWHPAAATRDVALSRLQTLGRRLRYRGDEYNADIAELELVPYLRTDREPCQDTVRLQLLADQLASNYAVSFFNTGNGVQLFSGGFLNGEGKDFRAAIDAAASANVGRARG